MRTVSGDWTSFDDAVGFITRIDSPLVRVVCTLILLTGIRPLECIRLRVGDVDFARAVIHVRTAHGNVVTRCHEVLMAPQLFSLLRGYVEQCGGGVDTRLFRLQDGRSPQIHYYNRVLHNTARKLGVEHRVTIHGFRRAYAIGLANQVRRYV